MFLRALFASGAKLRYFARLNEDLESYFPKTNKIVTYLNCKSLLTYIIIFTRKENFSLKT